MRRGEATIAGRRNYDRLPRGRHGIPRDVVTENQRERILGAATEVFAEQGFASFAVREVIDLAHVSRTAFYGLFDDKADCLLAAQRRALDILVEALASACATEQDWPSGVVAAVGVALEFTEQYRAETMLLLGSSHAFSEPELIRGGLAVQQGLIDLLHESAERIPSARSPSRIKEHAALGAAMSIVGSSIAARDGDSLDDLKPELAQIILTPYLGANEAKRVAHGG